MEYRDLVNNIVYEVIEEYNKENNPNINNEVVKTSDTPQDLTPLERDKARRRKIANKYDSYITDKLLPGLDK